MREVQRIILEANGVARVTLPFKAAKRVLDGECKAATYEPLPVGTYQMRVNTSLEAEGKTLFGTSTLHVR